MSQNSITHVTNESHALTVTETPAPDRHPVLVYIASLPSPHSRRGAKRHLNTIAEILGYPDALALNWGAIEYQHTQAIRTHLMSRYSPTSVNVMLSALRGCLKETWRLGFMTAEQYQRAIDIKNVKGETLPAGRDIKSGEFMALAQVCYEDDSPAGIRDSAMIGLLYTTGIRRSELVNLQVSDLEPETGKIEIHSGKGRKDRTVYVSNGALEAVNDWLGLRGMERGAVFLPIAKGGRIVRNDTKKDSLFETSGIIAGMTSQAVYNMLKKRAKQANVSDFSPHDFRRTFVGDMLDRGVDIVTVQKIAGHSDPATTSRYDRRPEAVKQAAAGKLHYPYKRRERLPLVD
jgi:site-specific recombinase XerD